MKKYSGVLQRVRQIEEKRGIIYAKTDGSLYKSLKIFYTVAVAYNLIINLMFIAGKLLDFERFGTSGRESMVNTVTTISACTGLIVIGYLLIRFRLDIVSTVITDTATVFMMFSFAGLLEDELGFLGLKGVYYWKHAIPLILVILFITWMAVIAVRAKIKTDRMYKKVIDNLFNMYKLGQDEVENITEEQWKAFLDSYNPEDYQGQFIREIAEQTAEDEADEAK